MIRIQKDKKIRKYATASCKETESNAHDSFEATIGCENEKSRRLIAPSDEGEDETLFDESFANGREFQKMKKETPSAFSASLRILQSGANSTRMLREKLLRKGFSKEEIASAICEVKKAGLVDDCRLLFSHAEYLARRKYYGKSRIRLALLQKFDRDVVEAYFEEATEEIDFLSYAKELVKKSSVKSREALIGKLKRNGYSSYEIRAALAEYAGSLRDEDAE